MIFIRFFIALLIVVSGIAVFFYPGFLKGNARQGIKGVTFVAEKFHPEPAPVENFSEPLEISAKSAIVIDNLTGASLFEKNAKARLLPASTTKLMTALVALESCSPNQLVTVSSTFDEPATMGLALGDVVTVETLLYGMLVASGNDASYALAGSCAPSIEEFVMKMNEKAKKLGMENSRFANPAGFDDIVEYSTAFDLAKLAKAAVTDPLIAKIVATKSIVLNDMSGTRNYYLANVNRLIGEVPGVEGIKTGKTDGAQENLITKTTRDHKTIIVVVLGSKDRFDDSKKLIEWTFLNYRWNQ
ncbi:D-alanyl-D-alanine carboxypeptidase [Candidatus Curtissbacteria bacterium]|nr:D-alanyl-D-alanine carboxypeptidase [Candidatus Curtissbacteria bacterium]